MKNKLGQITFWLTCLFVLLFICVSICNVWILSIRFDGWNNIFDMCLSMGNYIMIKMIGENFVVPIISCIVSLIYVIKIGQNKKINRFVYIITAMAILVEMFFYIFSNINSYLNSVLILPFLLRSGFLFAFVLLYIEYTKNFFRKIIYVIVGGSFISSVIYMIMYYINIITSIRQNIEILHGLELLYMYLDYLILPALGLIVSGLILCYILFPEKYLKSENSVSQEIFS